MPDSFYMTEMHKISIHYTGLWGARVGTWSGLEPGRVNWVKQVWPRFCIGSCGLVKASGSDQSNELSVLDSDDGRVSLDSPQNILGIDCTIRVF